MAIIKYSTNKTTWTTATVTGEGSTTWATSTVHSVAYSNGIWAAGNNQNQVAVSNTLGSFNIAGLPNNSNTGTNWTTVTSNFGNSDVNSINYGNGLWVAGGVVGQMRTSTDGTTWTTVTSNFGNNDIQTVAYGNGLWVAGGFLSQMRTSTNGSNWTTISSTFSGNLSIFSIAYNNDIWVAVGAYGQIRRSTNGSTWNTVTSNVASIRRLRSVDYGNGRWITGGYYGEMRTSTDGITWTTNSISWLTTFVGPASIMSVAYGNGLWIIGGRPLAQMRTSTDGITWTTVNRPWTPGAALESVRTIKYVNNLWIAAGYSSNDGATAIPVMIKSTNGSTWTTVTSNFGNNGAIATLAYGNNLWMAGGRPGAIRTSPQIYNTLSFPNTQISSFNTQFMAVSNNRPQSSTDGITWTTLSGFASVHVNKFVESNGKHVLLGNSGVLYEKNTSTTTWTTRSTGISDNFLNAAVNPSGDFIVRGNNALYRSTNLTTWTTISKPPASDVNDIIAK